ncbi:MAG: metal-sulfur cluster assembly factor [Chloroflexi bacterium]|nr:metal-sulfur cluster assembly factor [Chloroflexota bacterium]
MTDSTITTSEAPEQAPESASDASVSTAQDPGALARGPIPPGVDPQAHYTQLAILDALRTVVDPEIGMNVVELALIRQVILGENQTEIKMILTTPFCPYAGSMIQQVKEATEGVVDHEVKVTLLAERWDPRDAGLMW